MTKRILCVLAIAGAFSMTGLLTAGSGDKKSEASSESESRRQPAKPRRPAPTDADQGRQRSKEGSGDAGAKNGWFADARERACAFGAKADEKQRWLGWRGISAMVNLVWFIRTWEKAKDLYYKQNPDAFNKNDGTFAKFRKSLTDVNIWKMFAVKTLKNLTLGAVGSSQHKTTAMDVLLTYAAAVSLFNQGNQQHKHGLQYGRPTEWPAFPFMGKAKK